MLVSKDTLYPSSFLILFSPLLRFHRHNEDGSYTYGFEGADGSFKIETKLANGEVIGKYGYVDDSGKVRTIEYGANKYGFQPAGEGITVPPVTIGNDTDSSERQQFEDEEPQFVQVPVKSARPVQPPPKRKPQRPPPQTFFLQDEEERAQFRPQPIPQPYFVREQEDAPIRPSQRQFPGAPGSIPIRPEDINSLQFVIGDSSSLARPNEIPQQRRPPFQFPVASSEEQGAEGPAPPRPFPQGLPIPSVFDAAQAQISQFGSPSGEIEPQSAPVFRQARPQAPVRGQARPRPQPQFVFVSQAEEGAPQVPQQAAVRRNSNSGPGSRSILDDLVKQYSLPSGSPAINDFSFTNNLRS